MNHHIIYRQKTTITVAKESEVYAVQSVINDVIKNELPQLLQDVFDSIIPEGDIIRMESLQLDLGVLPAHNIRQAFKEQVVEKIRKAITVKKENAATENDVIIIHKEQSLRETFLYFLQYGVQPWFTVVKRREEWESGMQQWFAKTDWQKIVLWLRQNHQHQPVVIDRLVHQFSDDFLESIINNTISFGNENWKDIYRDLTALFTKNKGQAEALVRPKLLSLCLSSFLNTDSLPDALYDVVRTGIESYRAEVNISTSHSTKLSGEVIRTKILADIFERVNREQSQALKRDQNEMSIHTNDAILPGEFSSTEKLFKKNETLSEYNENKFSPGGIDGNSATENTTAEFSNQDAESKDFDPGKIKGNDSNISNISSSQYNENEFLPAGNDNNSTAKNATPEFSNRDTESKNYDTGKVEKSDSNISNISSGANLTPDISILRSDKLSPVKTKLLLSPAEKEPQYVSNSGIVLLHPFLEMYFTEFDLLHERKFKDDDACKHAVMLLHYLATGETEAGEWSLLLQK